jgi:hypothetical protein
MDTLKREQRTALLVALACSDPGAEVERSSRLRRHKQLDRVAVGIGDENLPRAIRA